MAWNYRKRVKILPGVHLNFSKSGVSTSIGPKGLKVSIGKKGTYLNTSIPGTGVYSRQKISGSHEEQEKKKPENDLLNKRESLFSFKNILKYLFILFGIIAILFIVVNLIQWMTGHFDSSEKNRDALLGYGVFAGLFILVYFKRVLSFFRRQTKKGTNNITDINNEH